MNVEASPTREVLEATTIVKDPINHSMHLLGTLTRTKRGKKHILVMTDRYSKHKREMKMAKNTASLVVESIIGHSVTGKAQERPEAAIK